MRLILERYSGKEAAAILVVLLPGAMQQPEDLLAAGFADAVRKCGLRIDLALIDFGLQFIGESNDGTVVRRLHDMLQQQAALHAYEEVWIAGISIGGAIAAAYVDTCIGTHADAGSGRIHGLCLLSPYPGNRMVTKVIREAGGVAHWLPEQTSGMDDGEFRLWRWLKHHRHTGLHLYLGYGVQDRFEPGLSLMAEAVDADCVVAVPGGHDLPVWQQLWKMFLQRLAQSPNRNRRAS